jgi:hypothetical protein
VNQQAVPVSGVAVWQNHRFAIDGQSEVTEDVRIEHLIHGLSIGHRPLTHAIECGLFGRTGLLQSHVAIIAERRFGQREMML